ncbi:hypothetical protein ACA910_022456 [Epithemia clementina (nom. ined.)]
MQCFSMREELEYDDEEENDVVAMSETSVTCKRNQEFDKELPKDPEQSLTTTTAPTATATASSRWQHAGTRFKRCARWLRLRYSRPFQQQLPQTQQPPLSSSAATTSSPSPVVAESSSSFSPAVVLIGRVAHGETKAVQCLRGVVLVLLVLTTTLVSVGVHRYTKHEETTKFETDYRRNAHKLVQEFHNAVERRLGSISTMSTAMTSFALYTNQSFPFVTIPDFALRGSDVRAQANALVIHYMPLITDDNRFEWEEYALANRFQIDEAFEQDAAFRASQDAAFGLLEIKKEADDASGGNRFLEANTTTTAEVQQQQQQPKQNQLQQQPQPTITVLEDGTNFHSRVWSIGALTPPGDEAEGSGPFLPLWQRSPINAGKQNVLNWNFASTHAFDGLLPKLLETKQAIMNQATSAMTEAARQNLAANLAISQFRHENLQPFIDDPSTFIAYPVFDSFDPNTRQIGGVLATNMLWKIVFEGILPSTAQGYICVLENSYNQTLSYRISGNQATFVGQYDAHDRDFDYLEESASINEYVRQQSGPRTRSYTTVPLSEEFGKYTLRIYPSHETKDSFATNDPILYTSLILSVFVFTSIVFIGFACVVERRQKIVMASAIENAEKAATTERELNEFLSHEIRNPLAAAISACSFVKSNLLQRPNGYNDGAETNENERTGGGQSPKQHAISKKEDLRKSLLDDLQIIDTSLCFVNDFLQSMLEMHRASVQEVEFDMRPVNLLEEVFTPVCTMLNQRCLQFTVTCDCSKDLVVSTYPLCLKQILLHLGVPATNAVVSGYVRFRAAVVNGLVELYVEDSGPGISANDRDSVFDVPETKFYKLREKNGIGLDFSQRLISALQGDIMLDKSYHCGIENSPGSRFVIHLRKAPIAAVVKNAPRRSVHKQLSSCDETMEGSSTMEEQSKHPLPENISVLIVDDDVILRKLFSRSIKRVAPSWTVEQAESGESAIRQVSTDQNFALIFMDQYMSNAPAKQDLTGTETIHIMRAQGVESRICGLSANDLENNFLESGANYFRLKPIPRDSEAMERWLAKLLGTT